MKSQTYKQHTLPVYALLFYTTLLSQLSAYTPDSFSHTQTSTWKEFIDSKDSAKKKWVLVSNITLKSKKAVKVKSLTLKWCGKKIPNLFASLFKKYKHNNNIIPIERNVISDGTWDNEKQQVIFPLDAKVIATQRYYLVLSYAKGLEEALKKGHFTLSKINCQEE